MKNGKRLPVYMEPEEMERLLAVSPPCHRLCFLLWARAGLRVTWYCQTPQPENPYA